jgi:hypothetical protein
MESLDLWPDGGSSVATGFWLAQQGRTASLAGALTPACLLACVRAQANGLTLASWATVRVSTRPKCLNPASARQRDMGGTTIHQMSTASYR